MMHRCFLRSDQCRRLISHRATRYAPVSPSFTRVSQRRRRRHPELLRPTRYSGKKFSSAADLARFELWMPSSLRALSRVFDFYRERQLRFTARIDGSTCVQADFSSRLEDILLVFAPARADSLRLLSGRCSDFVSGEIVGRST